MDETWAWEAYEIEIPHYKTTLKLERQFYMKSTSAKLFILRTNVKKVTAQIRKPISSSVTVWSFLSSTSPSETVFKS